jgi:hypothetical protein
MNSWENPMAKFRSDSMDEHTLQQLSAETNSAFVSALERWLMAVIQANYAKSDEEIVQRTVVSCNTTLAANISYHELVAKLYDGQEPVIMRQHRLLAHIYRALSAKDTNAQTS